MGKKKKKEPKKRNFLVAHVMRKGVQVHKNRKREAQIKGDKRIEKE